MGSGVGRVHRSVSPDRVGRDEKGCGWTDVLSVPEWELRERLKSVGSGMRQDHGGVTKDSRVELLGSLSSCSPVRPVFLFWTTSKKSKTHNVRIYFKFQLQTFKQTWFCFYLLILLLKIYL